MVGTAWAEQGYCSVDRRLVLSHPARSSVRQKVLEEANLWPPPGGFTWGALVVRRLQAELAPPRAKPSV